MIRVTTMRISDVSRVRALWKRTRGIGLNDSDAPSRIRSYLRRNSGMSFVARERGRIVGAVLCGHEGRRGYLHHLAVSPSFRRRGVGQLLVARCLTALRVKGITKCNAMLFRGNIPGLKFWKRTGWKVRRDLVLIQRVTH